MERQDFEVVEQGRDKLRRTNPDGNKTLYMKKVE